MPPGPGSGSDALVDQLDRAFDGLEAKIRECSKKFNAAVDHINKWSYVLLPEMLAIKPEIEKIGQELQKLIKLVKTAVEHHMPVVSLIIQSFSWIEKVQGPASSLSYNQSDENQNTSDIKYLWKGAAAEKYQDKVVGQNAAIDAAQEKAGNAGKWLIDIAKYNVEYMTELAKIVTKFLGALVSCAIEAATVVEIPFSVNNLSNAIGDLVTGELDNLVGIANRFMNTLKTVLDLKNQMGDPRVAGGQWPQAIAG